MRKKTRASGWRALASKNCAMTGLASAARGLAGAFIGGEAIERWPSFEARDALGGASDTGDVAADGQAREIQARPAAPFSRRKGADRGDLRAFRRRDAQSAHRTPLQDALHPA